MLFDGVYWLPIDLENAAQEGQSISSATARYTAPEVLAVLEAGALATASQSSDCFALGLLCYFVATGNDFFRTDEAAIRELTSLQGFALEESMLNAVEKPELKSAVKVQVCCGLTRSCVHSLFAC